MSFPIPDIPLRNPYHFSKSSLCEAILLTQVFYSFDEIVYLRHPLPVPINVIPIKYRTYA